MALKLIFAVLTDPLLDAKDSGASLLNQPYRKISANIGLGQAVASALQSAPAGGPAIPVGDGGSRFAIAR